MRVIANQLGIGRVVTLHHVTADPNTTAGRVALGRFTMRPIVYGGGLYAYNEAANNTAELLRYDPPTEGVRRISFARNDLDSIVAVSQSFARMGDTLYWLGFVTETDLFTSYYAFGAFSLATESYGTNSLVNISRRLASDEDPDWAGRPFYGPYYDPDEGFGRIYAIEQFEGNINPLIHVDGTRVWFTAWGSSPSFFPNPTYDALWVCYLDTTQGINDRTLTRVAGFIESAFNDATYMCVVGGYLWIVFSTGRVIRASTTSVVEVGAAVAPTGYYIDGVVTPSGVIYMPTAGRPSEGYPLLKINTTTSTVTQLGVLPIATQGGAYHDGYVYWSHSLYNPPTSAINAVVRLNVADDSWITATHLTTGQCPALAVGSDGNIYAAPLWQGTTGVGLRVARITPGDPPTITDHTPEDQNGLGSALANAVMALGPLVDGGNGMLYALPAGTLSQTVNGYNLWFVTRVDPYGDA